VRFWGFDQISEDQFLQHADVGDLLLFRGHHMGAKLTRSLTSSNFDHVAMIIKLQKNLDEVYFLEATEGAGVAVI